jgi:hypothetical protein
LIKVNSCSQKKEENSMEGIAEKIIKLGLFFIVVLACFLYWLLPRTRLSRHFKMNEKVFVVTQIISILCSIFGLVATFFWPNAIFELHLWELLALPIFLVYVYWFIVLKATRTTELVDEKQEFDMAKGSGLSMALTVPCMALLLNLYQRGTLEGLVWFPYYLFAALLLFSAGTLYNFKKF